MLIRGSYLVRGTVDIPISNVAVLMTEISNHIFYCLFLKISVWFTDLLVFHGFSYFDL